MAIDTHWANVMVSVKYGNILQHWLNVGPMLCHQSTLAIEWECLRWTQAQQWANVVYPTVMDQPLPDVGLTLGQRCLPNANGPTITQRWPNVCMLFLTSTESVQDATKSGLTVTGKARMIENTQFVILPQLLVFCYRRRIYL